MISVTLLFSLSIKDCMVYFIKEILNLKKIGK
ncbi:hypothetical protein ATE51_05027 (plasmid) [Campylobacter coli]|nr:hypothetical protein ATE51_05027 [Campylobacter coli]